MYYRKIKPFHHLAPRNWSCPGDLGWSIIWKVSVGISYKVDFIIGFPQKFNFSWYSRNFFVEAGGQQLNDQWSLNLWAANMKKQFLIF